MTDDNDKPVRGVNTIREELDKERNDNTYKSAFGALAMAVVGTIIAYVGYEYANTIYVWLWIGTGIAWIVGIGMLVFGKSMEDERHKKIAELEAELAEAMAARDGGRSRSDGAAATHGRSSVSATADAVKPEPTSPASPVLPPVPAVGATASASVAAPPMPGPAPRIGTGSRTRAGADAGHRSTAAGGRDATGHRDATRTVADRRTHRRDARRDDDPVT